MWGAPELNSVLQVGSQQSRVEGENHHPQSAGCGSFDACCPGYSKTQKAVAMFHATELLKNAVTDHYIFTYGSVCCM